MRRIKEDTLKIETEGLKDLKRKRKFFQKKDVYKISWKDRRKLRKKADKAYLITMFFPNGCLRTFVQTTTKRTFKVRGKTYFLHYEEAFYDLTMELYHLYYFEDIAVPINREMTLDGDEAYFTATPENLKQLIGFEYVKVLANAQNISKTLKFLLILSFITMASTIIQLLLGLRK